MAFFGSKSQAESSTATNCFNIAKPARVSFTRFIALRLMSEYTIDPKCTNQNLVDFFQKEKIAEMKKQPAPDGPIGLNHIPCANQSEALRLAHMATHSGHMTILRLLLTKSSPEHGTSNSGETVLHSAVREGRTDIIPELVRRGEDINITDFHGNTPLMWALMNGHIEAVKQLVSLGCDVNLCDAQGNTPLLMAIRLGCEEIVDILLEAGADVAAKGTPGENTALHEAIGRFASINIIRKLVAKGGKCLDIPNDHGVTPLLLAITHSSIHAVKLLLSVNVKVNYEARVMSFGFHNCTPIQHCLHQILLPLAQQTTSHQVTKKRVRNQMIILSMLLAAGATWYGQLSTLYSLVTKIKSYLEHLYNRDEFSLIVCCQLDEICKILSRPRSLLDLCRQSLRAFHGNNIADFVKTVPFAPYFQDFLLLSDLENNSCDYLSPYCT